MNQILDEVVRNPFNLRFAGPPWCGWSGAATLTAAGAETSTLSERGRSWDGRQRFRCGEIGHFTPSGAGGLPALTSASPPGPSHANTLQSAGRSR